MSPLSLDSSSVLSPPSCAQACPTCAGSSTQLMTTTSRPKFLAPSSNASTLGDPHLASLAGTTRATSLRTCSSRSSQTPSLGAPLAVAVSPSRARASPHALPSHPRLRSLASAFPIPSLRAPREAVQDVARALPMMHDTISRAFSSTHRCCAPRDARPDLQEARANAGPGTRARGVSKGCWCATCPAARQETEGRPHAKCRLPRFSSHLPSAEARVFWRL